MSCKPCLIRELVRTTLGLKSEEILTLFTDGRVKRVLAGKKTKSKCVWIGGRLTDPIYVFWQLHEAGLLGDPAYIIFTDIGENPRWVDLSVYESMMFGSMFFLVYSAVTNPGIKPSQKGMYMDRGSN